MNDDSPAPSHDTTRRRVLGIAALTPVVALAAPSAASADPRDRSSVAHAARPEAPDCIADLAAEL